MTLKEIHRMENWVFVLVILLLLQIRYYIMLYLKCFNIIYSRPSQEWHAIAHASTHALVIVHILLHALTLWSQQWRAACT